MTDDVRKLLGGYATGTLTDEEKKLLYDAALQDDELFAALADEQALKELLDDSAVRAQVLRATEDPRFSIRAAFGEWFERPKAKALLATAAVLLAIIGFRTARQTVEQRSGQVAEIRRAAPEALPPPIVESPPKSAPQSARKAAKPRQQTSNSIASEPVPDPTPQAAPPPSPAPAAKEAERDAVGGGVVGGVVGGVPTSSLARFKSATSEQAPALRYELLLKGADGEFRLISADHEFTPGDVVRIRVTSTQNGAIAIAAPGATLSASVMANQAKIIPETGGIAITPDNKPLVVTFATPDTTKSVQIPIHRRP